MKNKSFLSVVIFTFCLSLNVIAQICQETSVVYDVHKINSQFVGEERTVLVRVPESYNRANAKFPVVYMLDAHPPYNSMMPGMLDQQAWGGTMPEMILVGIQNTDRTRDLTPTKTTRPNSGGGDKFLDFIEKEVIPLVEKNYRTEPFRIFAGHSLGGLTVVYAFVSRSDLFNAYITASPVLHYDNDFVIKRAAEVFKQNKNWNKTMFIALGDEPDYVKGFNSFQDLLKKSKPKNFEYEFQIFKDDNHGSVALPAYYAGFRKIFAGWQPSASGAIADLENHYKNLSKRFGYEIKIPENTLNQIGYQLLGANRNTEAIAAFKKNVENYPNSANVYDSLAEALEKTGKLKESAENYEKAYKTAEKNGEMPLAKSAKVNFERVSAKIK